jgi:hypothetical protein
LPHGFPYFGHRWFFPIRELLLQVCIGETRFTIVHERVGNAQNHVAPASAGVKNAAPVTKPAIGFFELLFFAALDVERDHAVDCLGNLLSIRADVLHGRAAHAARNSAQALDAGAMMLYRGRDERIPILAGAYIEVGCAVTMAVVDSQKRNLQH